MKPAYYRIANQPTLPSFFEVEDDQKSWLYSFFACCFTFCPLLHIGMQYPGSSPDILETTESKEPQVPAPEKELGPTPNGGNGGGGGPPRAVSRSAMVKAVVEQEEEEKPVKNVCLVDTPQIFPATTSMTTRAVIESAASSSAEYVAPNHPKGINRMSRKLSFSRIIQRFFSRKRPMLPSLLFRTTQFHASS